MLELWLSDQPDIKVFTTVPYLTLGDIQDDKMKLSVTAAMIDEKYPQESRIHVYTDGSASNAVENGGEGILVHFPGGETAEASAATGKHCTTYHAEASTLMHAATMIQTDENNCTQVFFLSDALLILKDVQNNKLSYLSRALWQVAHTRTTVL